MCKDLTGINDAAVTVAMRQNGVGVQDKDPDQESMSPMTPQAGMLPIIKPKNVPVPDAGSGRSPASGRTGSTAGPQPSPVPRPTDRPVAKQVKPVPTGTAPLRASAAASRSNAAARRMLRKLVQGEAPPTAPMSIVERLAGSPYANPMIQAAGIDASARITLDFALDVAETMFRYGAGALEVETSIIAVTAAFGLSDIDVDITNQSVLINYAKPDTVPITVMRVVRSWTNNYAGLSLVHELVTDIVNGGVGRSEAKERLQEITSRPKPFPRWMAIGAGGVFSGAIVAFLGGSIFAALVGSISTLLMGLVGKKLSKWRMPDFFITGIGACLATVIALLFWALHVPLSPSLVIAGGILFLLPTGRLVSATQDAINGFPVTASGRYLSAFFTFAAIAAGVAVGLVGGAMTGISLPEVFVQGEGNYPYVVRALLLMVATMAICMTEQTKLNMLLPTAAVGLAGLVIYDFVLWAGIGDRIAPAVGAVVIGFLGRIVGLRMGTPQLVVAVPAVLFLLPGLSVFRSIFELTVNSEAPFNGILGLFGALTVILAIAGGAVLGDHLARPFTKGLGSNESRRARRR
ncbi:MAG TPA: threonine/serine exporter family protein [Arthrobacter sp.]|nr:threonine/serine exporter family protein [Arthrobacter sp.]